MSVCVWAWPSLPLFLQDRLGTLVTLTLVIEKFRKLKLTLYIDNTKYFPQYQKRQILLKYRGLAGQVNV